MRIKIIVAGGCVQSVYATDSNADVEIIDCDGDDRAEQRARAEAVDADPNFHPVLAA